MWSRTVWWKSLRWKVMRPGRCTLMMLHRKLWMNLQCAMELNIFIKLWRKYHHGSLSALVSTMCLSEVMNFKPLWIHSLFLFSFLTLNAYHFVHLFLIKVLLICSVFKIQGFYKLLLVLLLMHSIILMILIYSTVQKEFQCSRCNWNRVSQALCSFLLLWKLTSGYSELPEYM